MLTSDLSRFKIDGDMIKPAFISRKEAPEYIKVAEDLIKIFKYHIGKKRIELENNLERYESSKIDYKIYRGFAKIIESMCEFEPETSLDSEQVRNTVFELAQKEGPVVKNPDLLNRTTRNIVISKAAEILKCEEEEIEKALFGDLKSNYILKKIKGLLSPSIIIKRYNLALVQAILYRALDMKIKLFSDFKTVFKYIGLSRLMYIIKTIGKKGYFIEVSGPLSIFKKTRKYGVNFANLFSSLVLARRWEMSSKIDTRYGIKILRLTSKSGLTSFRSPEKMFDSLLEQKFYRNFLKSKNDWSIKREGEIINLDGKVLIPDFVFYNKEGKKVFLEIIGFWTPEYLTKKFEKLDKIENKNLILAINRNLNCSGEKLKNFYNRIIFFTTGIKVNEIVNLLNKI